MALATIALIAFLFIGGTAAWLLGEQPVTVRVNGGKHPLTRKHVMRVTETSPGSQPAAGSLAVGFQRVAVDDFPKGCLEEGFEVDPVTGRKLQVGENVEHMFVSKGFVLSTSIKTSHVTANDFAVAGKTAYPVWSDTRPQDLFLCPGTGTPGNPPQVCNGAGVNFSPANDQDIFTAAVSVP